MIFNGYFEMWNRYGVKLTDKIKITKGVLDRADLQNEVCDLIWIINAANQSNNSVDNLSQTVINELHVLALILLDHKAFNQYKTTAEVVKRAERHYKGDHLMPSRFVQRQPKIEMILKNYNQNGQALNVEMRRSNINPIADKVDNISTFLDPDDIKI